MYYSLVTSPFFFHVPPPPDIYTLSLHDALPIWGTHLEHQVRLGPEVRRRGHDLGAGGGPRSEEHTSELQSRRDLVCRLLLEKKNEVAADRHVRHAVQRVKDDAVQAAQLALPFRF